MKSPASAKEEREENYKIVSHGEPKMLVRSLWLIVFIGIIFSFGINSLYAQDKIKRMSLDNGMVVLLQENHNLPLVSLFLCVLTGSAREGEFSGSGISHFIEHMVFKGTATRKAGDIFREIESCGGEINAFTSYDYTGYKITVPSEFAFMALEVLTDMVMNATFEEKEFIKEREVVLKEVKLNYDDPRRYISMLLWQTAYSVHPYQYPILGQEHKFKGLNRENLLEFHREKYTPNNMVLAIVGDIEEEKTFSFVKDCFADLPEKDRADFVCESEPEQNQLRQQEVKFTTGLTYLLLGYHSVTIMDNDCFALDVLGAILGEGKSSRLYKLICEKKELAYGIGAINYTPSEPGLFIISCQLEEPYRRQVLSVIFEQIERVKKKLVSEDELESAKRKIISNLLFARQTIEVQAQDLALNEALTGDFGFTEKYIQKIKEVNPQDIQQVAQKYLHKNNLSIVALTPQRKSAKFDLDRNLSSEGFRIGIENLKKETLQNEKGRTKKYVFDNGLRLLVKENSDLPLVSIKVAFQGGLRAEEAHSSGLCNLVTQMLQQGTKTKDSLEIAYLVESQGARLSSFSGNNSFGLSLGFLSEDIDQMLALLADLIINSTFPQAEIRKQRKMCLAQIKAFEDNIFESGRKLLRATLFQRHPYRFVPIGNKESLKKLRRRDLLNFYRKFCVGKNMVIAVFGDVDEEEVLLKVKKLFAELNPGSPASIFPPEEARDKAVRRASKLLSKKQSLLLLGFPGTSVFSEDRFILEVICEVLSSASGRLFTEIREKSGFSYTLGAYQVLGLDPGFIVIYVATTSEVIETVKKQILHQLNLLQQNPLKEEQLLQAKRALLGKKLIGRQTNSACAMESSLDELYGLGYNYYLEYSDRINGVTAQDITRCAQKYFDLNNYAVVVMGPSTD